LPAAWDNPSLRAGGSQSHQKRQGRARRAVRCDQREDNNPRIGKTGERAGA
jgi:hypothetical protein